MGSTLIGYHNGQVKDFVRCLCKVYIQWNGIGSIGILRNSANLHIDRCSSLHHSIRSLALPENQALCYGIILLNGHIAQRQIHGLECFRCIQLRHPYQKGNDGLALRNPQAHNKVYKASRSRFLATGRALPQYQAFRLIGIFITDGPHFISILL